VEVNFSETFVLPLRVNNLRAVSAGSIPSSLTAEDLTSSMHTQWASLGAFKNKGKSEWYRAGQSVGRKQTNTSEGKLISMVLKPS